MFYHVLRFLGLVLQYEDEYSVWEIKQDPCYGV